MVVLGVVVGGEANGGAAQLLVSQVAIAFPETIRAVNKNNFFIFFSFL